MKYKILIVDDSFSSRSLLKNIIKKNHDFCELIGEAKNGQEGINMYKELQPDIVTMDLSMPVKNGVEATSEILSLNPKAKIVVVTGTTDETLIDKVKALGIENVIRKPFQSNALITVFKDLIAKDGTEIEEEEFAVSTPEKYKVNNHESFRPVVRESVRQETVRPVVQEPVRPVVQEPIRPVRPIEKPVQVVQPEQPTYAPPLRNVEPQVPTNENREESRENVTRQQDVLRQKEQTSYVPNEQFRPNYVEQDRNEQPIYQKTSEPVGDKNNQRHVVVEDAQEIPLSPTYPSKPIVVENNQQTVVMKEEVKTLPNVYETNPNPTVYQQIPSTIEEDDDEDEYTPNPNLAHNNSFVEEDDEDEYTPPTDSVYVKEETVQSINKQVEEIVYKPIQNNVQESYVKPENVTERPVYKQENTQVDTVYTQPIVRNERPVVQEQPRVVEEQVVEQNIEDRKINPVYNETIEQPFSRDSFKPIQTVQEPVKEIVEEDVVPSPVYESVKEKTEPLQTSVYEPPVTKQKPVVHEEKTIQDNHQNEEDYKEVYKPVNSKADEDIIPLPNLGQNVFVPQYEDKTAFELKGTSKQLSTPIHWDDDESDVNSVDEMSMVLPGQNKEVSTQPVAPQPVRPVAPTPPTQNRQNEQQIQNPAQRENFGQTQVPRPPQPTQPVPQMPSQNLAPVPPNRVAPPRPDRLPTQPPRPPMPQRSEVAPPPPSREVAQPPRNPNAGHTGNYGVRPPQGQGNQQFNQQGSQGTPAPYYNRDEQQGRGNPTPPRQVPQQQNNYPVPIDHNQIAQREQVEEKGKGKKEKKEKGGGLFGFIKGLFGKK